MKYSTKLDEFLTFLRDCDQEHEAASAAEEELNAQTQDLLHCLELTDNKYHDLARISKALGAVRQERREAKDKEMILEPITEWIQQNGRTIKELERLLGAVRKAERNTEGRIYTPRTDIVDKVLCSEK